MSLWIHKPNISQAVKAELTAAYEVTYKAWRQNFTRAVPSAIYKELTRRGSPGYGLSVDVAEVEYNQSAIAGRDLFHLKFYFERYDKQDQIIFNLGTELAATGGVFGQIFGYPTVEADNKDSLTYADGNGGHFYREVSLFGSSKSLVNAVNKLVTDKIDVKAIGSYPKPPSQFVGSVKG